MILQKVVHIESSNGVQVSCVSVVSYVWNLGWVLEMTTGNSVFRMIQTFFSYFQQLLCSRIFISDNKNYLGGPCEKHKTFLAQR